MIAETVKAVRDAEAEADELIAKAKLEAADIQKESEQKCRQILEDAENAARKMYDEKMAGARADGKAELARADEETLRETEALKLAAADREKSVVDRVIGSLIG